MKKQTLLYVGLMITLPLSVGCTRVTGTLAGWDGARLNISSPANLGKKSVFGITWCTVPDRICQKSHRKTELKPGVLPAGGGYSVSPSNNIRVPKRMEVSWYDAQGKNHQQVVELDIPGREEVIHRYGAPRSTRGRFWSIVLIFKDDEPITYAWLLYDATDMGYRHKKFTPPKALVYGGNIDIVKRFIEPGEEETMIRYEPEN
ncbi:MAG: hypothetical protein KME63_18865 [Candidatus Thiodiazotropha sp. (ex Clathrolucina costata)]|nr:hypothetical protein [Candidatus Thiodiazotropha taylori]MBT3032912.1 hypothetical protein [Candidatus Thiodiazotropha sp. (ex Lucina pensylvanica)]MBT3052563.1 hypothetical protein [Candidatus Thiodiazotropha sp. (ex Codakia orbicularis)]MCG7861537.1 hypothetical protein [Candidatus Thiodiazotropha endolucinida]